MFTAKNKGYEKKEKVKVERARAYASATVTEAAKAVSALKQYKKDFAAMKKRLIHRGKVTAVMMSRTAAKSSAKRVAKKVWRQLTAQENKKVNGAKSALAASLE